MTLVVLIRQFNFPGADVLSVLAAVLACGMLALLGYPAFQRFFEHRVLGMPLAPEGLARAYAARITTSLERPVLGKLLLEEVMPSLLVRQFAQVELKNGTLRPMFSLRVEADMLPAAESGMVLAQAAGREWMDAAGLLPAWIRLVIGLPAPCNSSSKPG